VYPGAKNMEMTSVTFQIDGYPDVDIPNNVSEARNYMTGLNRDGEVVDPCNWYYGEVRGGVLCNEVNPYYWLSGDPVADIGWIGTFHLDVRGPGNTGPFVLVKDEEIEILIGYEVNRDSTPIGGITAVKNVSDVVQAFYDSNFGYPIVTVEDEQHIVSNFKLEQNYPNPFNPSTTIKYQIPELGFVTLKIFDVLGKEIETLVNEEKQTGTYEITWNAESLPTGVYFYRLQAEDFVETNKMVLMK
jgi:hypothetical protein